MHFHFYRTNVNSSIQLLKFSSCVRLRYYLLLFIYAVSGLGPRANCKGSVCKVLGDTPTQYRKGYLKEFFFKVFVCYDRAESTQKYARLFDSACN